mmetsp:Transcript_36611/g.37033  ORF Transcript_36611/g.37033 Transcript_36611/m.37033 type:complete len:139 (-) Transcript_36611:144-560(-)
MIMPVVPIPIPIMPTPTSNQLLRNTSNTTKNCFSDCSRMRSAATATTTATSQSQSLHNYFRSEHDIDLESDCDDDSEEEEAKLQSRVHSEQQHTLYQKAEEDEEDEETLDAIYTDLLRRHSEYHPRDSENDAGKDIEY